MKLFLVDTNVFVDFFRGKPEAVAFIKRHSDRIALSAVVLSELYAGAREDEIQRLDTFSDYFTTLPLTTEVAKTGGLLKNQYGKSHGIGLADALIAATAQTGDCELKTLNVKHYPMFPSLSPPYGK